MRQQAIEKLGNKIVEELEQSYSPKSQKLTQLMAKWRILTDRSDEDRAASVIREVMNS